MNPAAPYVFGAWLLGWPIAARLIYRYWVTDPEPSDRVMSGVTAILWPFVAVIVLGSLLMAMPTLGVRTPAERAARAMARQRERERLQQRIDDLERELDMRP